MSTLPTLSSTLKIPSFSRLTLQIHNQTVSFRSSSSSLTRTQPFNHLKPSRKSFGLGLLGTSRNLSSFRLYAENGKGEGKKRELDDDEAERLARGESTMPDRFKYLTKEAPDPPLRWPFFVALGFLVYAWRAVLFELGNWKKAALAIFSFVGYLLKLLLALIFNFIGDPITFSIRCIEDVIYNTRAFYSGIVAYAPVPELTTIIVLASAVLAVGEAAVPNAVSSQPYIITISGLIGYAAVKNYISEQLFWTLLLSVYGFSRLVKKRDEVTSALPAAAVLAAIGEPWIRVLVIVSYVALAISQYSKKISKEKEEVVDATTHKEIPVPLLCIALAIGIRLAAKWAGYRHLTWKIV